MSLSSSLVIITIANRYILITCHNTYKHCLISVIAMPLPDCFQPISDPTLCLLRYRNANPWLFSSDKPISNGIKQRFRILQSHYFLGCVIITSRCLNKSMSKKIAGCVLGARRKRMAKRWRQLRRVLISPSNPLFRFLDPKTGTSCRSRFSVMKLKGKDSQFVWTVVLLELNKQFGGQC